MLPVPPCPHPGSCTYWVVATQVTQVTDISGRSCYTTLEGDVSASFNPACANIGFDELLKFCDGWNSGGNDCFAYYSNVSQIFPNGAADTLSVDSLMHMFALGAGGGFLTYMSVVGWALAIIVVAGLFNYVVTKT